MVVKSWLKLDGYLRWGGKGWVSKVNKVSTIEKKGCHREVATATYVYKQMNANKSKQNSKCNIFKRYEGSKKCAKVSNQHKNNCKNY